MLSIITPILNGAKYIEQNINSILSLEIPYEHIIVDGGSSDEIFIILKKYPHIKLIHQIGNNGMYEGVNQGLLNASGDLLCYVNADDYINKIGFEKMYYTILEKNIDVIYSNSMLIYESTNLKKTYKGNRFAKFFLNRGIFPFAQPSCIFTKKIFLENKGFNSDSFKICGDLDFFYRISRNKTSKFYYCDILSTYFLVREKSLGNTNSEKVTMEKMKNHIPFNLNIKNRFLFHITKFL